MNKFGGVFSVMFDKIYAKLKKMADVYAIWLKPKWQNLCWFAAFFVFIFLIVIINSRRLGEKNINHVPLVPLASLTIINENISLQIERENLTLEEVLDIYKQQVEKNIEQINKLSINKRTEDIKSLARIINYRVSNLSINRLNRRLADIVSNAISEHNQNIYKSNTSIFIGDKKTE
ncbi:MAG: hypothetical protein LBH03_03185 [Holophagales bacterium]|jgi:hypothetical protein|nr:hypothetical protein [Holophagales bacterium]